MAVLWVARLDEQKVDGKAAPKVAPMAMQMVVQKAVEWVVTLERQSKEADSVSRSSRSVYLSLHNSRVKGRE